MARIAHLAYLLVAVGTLPALAQSGYSEPPLPGDASEAWDAPPEPFDEEPEAEDEEGEDAEQVPGAAAGPANEEEARAFEAYLQELESNRETSDAPLTGISEDASGSTPATPAVATGSRPADAGVFVAQNPYVSLTMDVGGAARNSETSTMVDFGLRFEGDRGGLLITFGGRIQDRVIGGVGSRETYSVFSLEPTFAVIAEENLRWRLRGGWSVALNDRVSMSGISLGSSLVVHIAGPVDFEADVHLTPFPFLRAEAKAAFALHFGFVSLRMGWMGSNLTDHGLGTGSSNAPIRTSFSGAYLGAGLHF